ncbi:MAG: peptidoglycan-N-acetylglucosamine deacetylase [Cryptosporangiaceae bacterium]|nr:peptidoglycan-N-acetylglucosamine deacetylase [Cryptosporangiaceae bacterium]
MVFRIRPLSVTLVLSCGLMLSASPAHSSERTATAPSVAAAATPHALAVVPPPRAAAPRVVPPRVVPPRAVAPRVLPPRSAAASLGLSTARRGAVVSAAPTAANPALRVRRTTGTAAVALTFDDGPDPRWTPQVLGLLRKYQIKATFCLIGGQARAHPALVKQIVREGHSLCNHTMRHDEHLKNKSAQRIAADLAQTSALIKSASGGIAPRFFRAPGGNWSTRITAVAASQHMQSLGWAVDPQDWRRPPAARIITTVERTTRAGSVILMHDAGGNRAQTVAALRTLLPYLKAHYRLVAL